MTKTSAKGTVVEGRDDAFMATIRDGIKRKSNQTITILLDELEYNDFRDLILAKRVSISILE